MKSQPQIPALTGPTHDNEAHSDLESPLISIPASSIPQHQTLSPESTSLLLSYMMLAGFISHFPLFMMLTEVHTFNRKFKKYNYSFFILMPTYVCIPYSLLGSRLLVNLSYTTQIHLNIVGALSFMFSIFALFWHFHFEDEYTSKP